MIQARYRSKDAHRPSSDRAVNANTRQAPGNLRTVVDAGNAHLIVGFQARVILVFVQVETRETNTQLTQKRCAERVRVSHRWYMILRVGSSRLSAPDGR